MAVRRHRDWLIGSLWVAGPVCRAEELFTLQRHACISAAPRVQHVQCGRVQTLVDKLGRGGGGGGRVRWGSSLNPHNDLFTEIKTDKKQGGVERGWYRTFKQHQVSPCTVTPPPLPVPWGHLILLYPICQHHCPHISFQPPKYWVSAWLIEGNSPQENLRKIELEGECCGWNMFAFIPRGDYRLQPSPIYFLAQCVLA